jgi:hypothetical protein
MIESSGHWFIGERLGAERWWLTTGERVPGTTGDGQCVRQWGLENVQRTSDFWGRTGQIGVKKWQFLAKKVVKKAIFCVPEGKLAGGEAFPAKLRILCQI